MNPEEYMVERLDEQINWYDNKSKECQKWYKRFQVTEIIIASSIPIFSGYTTKHYLLPIVIGILGSTIAIIEGITKLYKFHENWIQYRTTCEVLKHEKYLYLTQTPPYNCENSFQILVERVESMISSENISWSQLHSKQTESVHCNNT